MKTIIAIIIMAITGVCIFTGCTMLSWAVGKLDPNTLEKGWSHKAHLEKLMNYSKKKLLSEDKRNKASQDICELRHLNKKDRTKILQEYAEKFCKLQENDKIYFYDWCNECGGAINTKDTSYLLVRDGKPFESISIDKRYSKELGRSIPIVERLH